MNTLVTGSRLLTPEERIALEKATLILHEEFDKIFKENPPKRYIPKKDRTDK